MGDFNITIRGLGAHHNRPKYDKDANRMAAAFVQELKDAGHTIKSASITHGGEDDLSDPAAYLAERDQVDQ